MVTNHIMVMLWWHTDQVFHWNPKCWSNWHCHPSSRTAPAGLKDYHGIIYCVCCTLSKKALKIFTVIPTESPSFLVHQCCNSICGEPVTLTSLSLTESTILGKILNTATEEPMTSWSHKYYVLCFPHCCLMFHIEVGTIKQTTAHKRMGPLIPRGIILVEGVFSTGPARKSY